MPELDQVPGGQAAAVLVVDGDRAVRVAARAAVDEDDRDVVGGQPGQPFGRGFVDRGDEQAEDPLLLEDLQVALLPREVLAGVAHGDHAAGRVDQRLGPAHDVGEERVGHVEDDDGDVAAAPGPQLAGRVVAHVAQLGDGGLDPRAGVFGDGFGAVEDVGDRADRYARGPGHVFHAGSAHRHLTESIEGRHADCAASEPERGRASVRWCRVPPRG
ncbi:hypothetical protein GCM10029992_45380 [Glycomyces albus]